MDDMTDIKALDFDLNEDTPERKLVRLVFFRALADLSPHTPKPIRRDAILWFEDDCPDFTPPEEKGCYSFLDICEILDFSDIRIKKIRERAAESRETLGVQVNVARGYTFKARMYQDYVEN